MRNNRNALATLLLLGAVLFNLVVLWPEVAVDTPPLNDSVLHRSLVERAAEALERGEDPTDPWVPYFVQGYPLFHHYQHLPHLVNALLGQGLGGVVSLSTLFSLLGYLLLSTFPLSIYWSGRRLDFGPLPAASAGLVASLLSTDGLYGLDLGSYVWRGYGMYTQLWGMWLLGPALANLYVTLRRGRAYAGTAALLAATLLCHTVLGYVALVSGVLLALGIDRPGLGRRIGRLVLVVALVVLAASYFLLPFFQDRLYMNRSQWEDPGKYDAYGWEWTLGALVRGELLDHGRFPGLTLLAALGLFVCLLRWREADRYRLLVIFSGIWLLLYFGRPTWGVLLDLLPLSRDLHLHRLIAPVHLGAIGLAGGGLALILEGTLSRQPWRAAGAGVLALGLLGPVYAERIDYLTDNARWLRQNRAAFRADGEALEGLLADLAELPPGRVYAGRSTNWGDGYRVGNVPVYALLVLDQFDSPGYLYHALSLNADVEGYLDETRPATFDLFNLRYVVAPAGQPPPAFARPLAVYGPHHLYQVATSGYFDLVDSDQVWYGDRSDWFPAIQAWIQSGWVEARQHPRIVFGSPPAGGASARPLDEAPGALANQTPPRRGACGQILDERVGGNRYAVEFRADRACWLLFKGSFHPGWRASLDGQPAPTHMLAPSFVGLAVAPGRHRVELVYEPGGLRAWLRLVGLGGLLLAALAEWQRERWEARAARALAPLVGAKKRWSPVWERVRPVLGACWRQEGKWVVSLLAFVLLVGLPTLQFKLMSGHDALEYLPRTVEFYQELGAGRLLPRWAPDLSSGYGQPFFIFNPPFIYYAASVFHALGFSLVASLDLACLGLLALGGLGMYLFARDLVGRAGGLVAGVAYVLAPFTLVNLYVRHALADYSAMAFIPWALWGLGGWLRPRPKVGYLFVASGAVGLLLLSSNPVALVTVPALLAYGLFVAWQARSWQVLGRGGWALGLGLGLAAFFWLPALADRNGVKTYRLLGGHLHYRNHFVSPRQLLYSPWGYGLSVPGPGDGMSFGLGLAHLALLAVSLVLVWRLPGSRRARAHLGFFVGLLGVAAWLVTPSSAWLWDHLPLLPYLEFPWRILILAAVATALICAFPLALVREPRLRRWLLLAVLGALLLTGLPHAQPEGYYEVSDAEFAPEVIASQGLAVTTAREYEPIWVKSPPPEPAPPSKLLVLEGRARILQSRLTSTHYRWQVEVASPARLRVATFYFPGWRLEVDGQSRPLTVQNPYGLMDFVLGAGTHQVDVRFGSTPTRRRAVVVSVGAWLLLGLTMAAPILGQKRQARRRRPSLDAT